MTAKTAEVAVFAGLRGPARTFSYLVPDGLDLLPGHLVRVGLGQRAVPGVVVALDGAPAGRELRPVDALVHPLPLLRPHQLVLATWIAERYRCGLADARLLDGNGDDRDRARGSARRSLETGAGDRRHRSGA